MAPTQIPGEHSWQRKLALLTCWVQGAYFVLFGLWPVFHMESFQAVTGQKTDHLVTGRESDHWLVNTVALLIVAIGLVLIVAAWRRQHSTEIVLWGISSAVVLAGIDVVYTFRQTISPIYLADAAVEVLIIAGWTVSRMRSTSLG